MNMHFVFTTIYCIDMPIKPRIFFVFSDVIAIGLMIDKIISQFDGLWLSAVGKEHYPPSSLHVSVKLI